MKRMLIAGATLAAATVAIPAQAAPVIFFTPGVYNTFPIATTAAIFEDFESGTTGAQYVPSNPRETVVGSATIQNGNINNTTADPDPSSPGKYLSIGSNSTAPAVSSFTYNFLANGGSPVQFLSFILGSLDTYNTLTLNFTSGGPITYSGAQIVNLAPALVGFNGNGNSSLGGRVSYDAQGGPGITSATFSSTFAAFEIDQLASAVPEPGAWALMILGLGMAGASLRTRRRKVTFATA